MNIFNDLTDYVDDSIIYKGYMLKAYIPDDYIKRNLMYDVSEGKMLFGNFTVAHFKDENTSYEDAIKANFELPIMFHTIPDEVEKVNIDLGHGHGIERFHVLKFYNGSTIIQMKEIIKSPNNVERMTILLNEGKLDIMHYDRIPNVYNTCKVMNGVGLRVPALYEETLIATTYKDAKDISKPARMTAKSTGTIVRGLTSRERVPFANTFSGVGYEDKINMLVVAHNKKMSGGEEPVSDIEKFALGID